MSTRVLSRFVMLAALVVLIGAFVLRGCRDSRATAQPVLMTDRTLLERCIDAPNGRDSVCEFQLAREWEGGAFVALSHGVD